jgi:hypothetical protein
MRNLTVAAAVAAALASAAASAAGNVDVYISGASAQKNFWYADLANIANCSTLTGNKWNGTATAPFTKAPDFSYVQCTAGSSPLNSNISPGVTVTFHYSAELGSVWGVANALGQVVGGNYPKTHLFLQNAGTCVPVPYVIANASFTGGGGAACAGGQYDLYTNGGTDSIVGGNPAYITSAVPDIDVSDVEPSKFQFSDNWSTANNGGTNAPPLYKALGITVAGSAPTLAQLSKVQTAKGATFVNGEVFAIITNFVGTTVKDPGNFSYDTLSAILQGDYGTWAEAPEIGPAGDTAGTPIVLVRRDHGSGSQIAASVTFTGQECGIPNDGGMEQDTGSGGSAILAGSTSAMRTIVNANAGSIGYLSLTGNVPNQNEADNYNLESVDGYQPNAHNSAAGLYRFATQTWAYTPDASTSVAQTMINRAGSPTAIAQVLGNETVTKAANGAYSTAAGAEVGAYGITGLFGNAGSASATGTGVNNLTNIPVSLRNLGGESCTFSAGQN